MALSGSAGRRYAEALSDLASDPASVERFRASLERLSSAIGPETIAVLRDPRVSLEHRRDALTGAIRTNMILGAALTEGLGILAFVLGILLWTKTV